MGGAGPMSPDEKLLVRLRVEHLLFECGEHEVVIVCYDEHGNIREAPERVPLAPQTFPAPQLLRPTCPGSRFSLEIHDLP
jgi:hypothetical protein